MVGSAREDQVGRASVVAAAKDDVALRLDNATRISIDEAIGERERPNGSQDVGTLQIEAPDSRRVDSQVVEDFGARKVEDIGSGGIHQHRSRVVIKGTAGGVSPITGNAEDTRRARRIKRSARNGERIV